MALVLATIAFVPARLVCVYLVVVAFAGGSGFGQGEFMDDGFWIQAHP